MRQADAACSLRARPGAEVPRAEDPPGLPLRILRRRPRPSETETHRLTQMSYHGAPERAPGRPRTHALAGQCGVFRPRGYLGASGSSFSQNLSVSPQLLRHDRTAAKLTWRPAGNIPSTWVRWGRRQSVAARAPGNAPPPPLAGPGRMFRGRQTPGVASPGRRSPGWERSHRSCPQGVLSICLSVSPAAPALGSQ